MNKTYSLAIMSSYTHVEIGLCAYETLISTQSIPHTDASRELMPAIETLLVNNKLTLSNLNYITVNQGPGPFTTLRTIIATVNGLSFATNISLIGVDALNALLNEHPFSGISIALLNAYAQDLYYGIKKFENDFISGYKNFELLFTDLKSVYHAQQIQFLGNGALMYKNELIRHFGTSAIFPEPFPEHCTLKAIAEEGYSRWTRKKELSRELFPLYVKAYSLQRKTV